VRLFDVGLALGVRGMLSGNVEEASRGHVDTRVTICIMYMLHVCASSQGDRQHDETTHHDELTKGQNGQITLDPRPRD
jgi:hypothetical protein